MLIATWMFHLLRLLTNSWMYYRVITPSVELRRNMKNLFVNVKFISYNKYPKCMHLETESSGNMTSDGVENSMDDSSSTTSSQLEEPTTCCMSGCANCVWIQYAEELSKRYRDGGEKAREAIMKISDPNMKAFLLTELKSIKTE
ncbi:hypothetical protein J437_LFUL010813 [Ladona fulva]|uniref:Oxidoreductase-like domain-containing protein n=1 Tax=Ladona fulva TaxID=123851 RepID=A0A8K0P0D2_LADFU|nr:hypothetical protein J437_LFUL010813 [Ladona fulva]